MRKKEATRTSFYNYDRVENIYKAEYEKVVYTPFRGTKRETRRYSPEYLRHEERQRNMMFNIMDEIIEIFRGGKSDELRQNRKRVL